MSPHTPVHLYVLRLLHFVGGCKGLPYVLGHFPYTIPIWGASPSVAPPHSVVGFPVHQYVLGNIYIMWVFSPSVGGLGVFHHHLGVLGITPVLMMSICSFLYIFVVHYVLFFYCSYDYYSSGYGGIFLPVISLISDSGSFLDGVSSKLGSAWSGSSTTLEAERL